MPITPEYASWAAMKQRCFNPRTKSFKHYGGRGISVCMRWRDFDSFLEDMGVRPSKRHSLERPDNDASYACGSCDECLSNDRPRNGKWGTVEEQASNKRNNRKLSFNGKTQTAAEWARDLGLTPTTLHQRLETWPLEKALSAEPNSTRKGAIGPRGSQQGNARLTEELIPAIREALRTQSQSVVAKAFGVSRGSIADIAQGKTWKHVKS